MRQTQWTERYGPTAMVTGASSGIEASCCVCDLSDLAQVDTLIEQAQSNGVGLVISNAGYLSPCFGYCPTGLPSQWLAMV